MTTQQGVIKAFMKSLDETTLSPTEALDAAIRACSNFVSLQDLIDNMVSDCKSAKSADAFLKNCCGINLDNDDTGAITGSDAGGSKVKTVESIVTEKGTASTFTGNSFTVNGLTVKLDKSYSNLSAYEKYLWNNLHTYWVKNALNLIAESYGNNFSFNSNSTVREITIVFFNEDTGDLAISAPTFAASDQKTTTGLTLKINLSYYKTAAVDYGDLDGKPNSYALNYWIDDAKYAYIDRNIAHELTHGVMLANINYCRQLPLIILEGMAELTHGADDLRKSDLKALAANPTKLSRVLKGATAVSGIINPVYSGGYMLLRYLARQVLRISNNANNKRVNGTNDSDTINNSGNYVTIAGNVGDDSISLTSDAANNLIVYRAGDGDDIIQGFNATSTLSISGGSYYTVKSGNSIMVNVGDAVITLTGATNLSAVHIDGKQVIPTLTLTDRDSDKMTLPTSILSANATARTAAITIIGNGLDNSISGGKGNDSLLGLSGDDTLFGGLGNDMLWGGSGNDLFVYREGNDLIADYTTADKISLGASIDNATLKGSDAVLTIGDDSLTIRNAKDKTLNLIDSTGKELSTVISGAKTVTLTDRNSAKVTLPATYQIADATARTAAITIIGNGLDNSISGGKGNDSLLGLSGDDTLFGGLGNDMLWGGSGNDLFVYREGNDLIADYTTADKISLGASIDNATLKGSDAVLTIGDDSLTIRNAKDKTLNLIDSTGKELSTVISGAKTVTLTDRNSAKVTLPATYQIAYANARTTAITIIGNGLDNTILGGSGNDAITSGAGADSLNGGAGDDKIWGGNDGDTLTGGLGNDSLWGGNGADTFVYNNGDGKDIIYGFEDDDMLQITGAFTTAYNEKANALYFKVGSTPGALLLKDIAATTFNINGDNYAISGNHLVKS